MTLEKYRWEKVTLQREHEQFKKPNWWEADQLTISKRSLGGDSGKTLTFFVSQDESMSVDMIMSFLCQKLNANENN